MSFNMMTGLARKFMARSLCAAASVALAAGTVHSKTPDDSNYEMSGVVRDLGYLKMKDGTHIAYISYRPKSGRHPTIFVYSPYSRSTMPFETVKPFLDAGWAVVGADWRATGCSEGVVDHFLTTRFEGKDGAEVVEWIAKQSWSDGNVGMAGNSYDGAGPIMVAAERPPHLKAIVPTGLADGYYTMAYLGGMLQPSMYEWENRTFYGTTMEGADWRAKHGDAECKKIVGSSRQVRKRPFFDVIREHPYNDQWWHQVSPGRPELVDKINVPTMIIADYQDEYGGVGRQSTEIFSRIARNTKTAKLIMMNGNHLSEDGVNPIGYPFVRVEQMRFLDRWVRGIRNGIDKEPPIKLYWEVTADPTKIVTSWVTDMDVTKAVPGWTTTLNTWPDSRVVRRPFYLMPDASLSATEGGLQSKEGVRSYMYPTGVELVGNQTQFAVLPNKSGVLNYRTGPMESDMALVGNPDVTIYLSIDHGNDVDLVLTLKDVGPDGSVTYVQTGMQRASFQEIDEAQSTPDNIVHTFAKSEPLTPGKIYAVRMSLLGPVAHVVRKGHSLELTIGAPTPIPHHGSIPAGGSMPAGTLTNVHLYQSQIHPSKIILPIIPEFVAQGPTPQCGTLVNQPCRKQPEFIPGGLMNKPE